MAGEITSSTPAATQTTTTETTNGYLNENSVLDKDSFLKLLLTELKYQDPTSPMETDKMLSQTADLTVVEAQNAMKDSIESLAAQMKTTSSYGLIDAVGKYADTGNDSISFQFRGEPTEIDVFFKEAPLSGNFNVYDSSDNLVRSIPLSESDLLHLQTNTMQTFSWDGEDTNNIPVNSGIYRVEIEYTGAESKEIITAKPGVHPIESVKFSNGEPKIKLGNDYYKLDEIEEITQTI